MALTFNGVSSSLTRSGQIVSNYPFTIFAWTRAAAAQAGFVAELAADPGSNGGHEGHGALSNGTWMRAWSSTGNPASAYSERLISVGDWVPCMAVFLSISLRKIYYGSGAVQVDVNISPQTPSILREFAVGRMAVRDALYWKGDLASVGLWSTELTAADFAQLAAGAVPSTIQSAAIVDYWSLQSQAATQVGLNGRVLAATNTAQAADHPIVEAQPGPGGDTVPPTLVGPVLVSALTATSYTLGWPAGSDNVAVQSYDLSLDGAASWSNVGNSLTANVAGRVPGSTDQVRVRARDAAGSVSSPPLGTAVTLLQASDTSLPSLIGSITVSAVTPTAYTLAWPAGTDNLAVTSYERSLDAGASWVDLGNVLTVGISGRTPGSTDQVRIRAKDAAGNVSSPPLATAVVLPVQGSGAILSPPLKNNTGTLLASLTGVAVNVYNAGTGVLVVRKTGLVSDALGVVTISDIALVPGTAYAYEVVTPANGRRLPLGTAI